MTDRQRNILVGDAKNNNDRDSFVSDWALSSIWGDDADISKAAEQCGKIWDAVHKPMGEIRASMGLTQAQMAERLCVPKRTLENWEYKGTCPVYVRILIARVWMGLE
nr:MAG TPA: helix-turn-helix domain protein [Caudoviricetes sp.]